MPELRDRNLIVEADAANLAVQQDLRPSVLDAARGQDCMRQLGGMVNGRLTGGRAVTAVGARISPILLVISRLARSGRGVPGMAGTR
jgi:hypothetical protein